MSTFALYMIGYVMIIGGLDYGAFRLGIPQVWIIIGTIIVMGIGFTTGASRTRQRDT